jgi:hypothetical protein
MDPSIAQATWAAAAACRHCASPEYRPRLFKSVPAGTILPACSNRGADQDHREVDTHMEAKGIRRR